MRSKASYQSWLKKPFKNKLPLSFEGEGDKGGEIDNQSLDIPIDKQPL